MKAYRILAIFVLAAVGCTPATNSNNKAGEVSETHPTAEQESLPSRITNQFVMTFRLVTIDTSRPDHKDSFPKRSYYLQETELTGEQHYAFRKAAFSDGTYETINWHSNNGFPSEWRPVFRYAEALSKFDTEYDYGVPSRSQWLFACMSGYEQRCDEDKPNAFAVVDMLDGDVEPIDELTTWKGHEYGTLMGRWINNWGEHISRPKPDCPCEHWTLCNPDSDDGLNEIIVSRFILLPAGSDVAK